MATAIALSSPKSSILQNPTSFRDQSSSFLGGQLKGLSLELKPARGGRIKSRRTATSLVVASAATEDAAVTTKSGRFYLNFTGFPFPLGPFLNRRTIRTEVSFSRRFPLPLRLLILHNCAADRWTGRVLFLPMFLLWGSFDWNIWHGGFHNKNSKLIVIQISTRRAFFIVSKIRPKHSWICWVDTRHWERDVTRKSALHKVLGVIAEVACFHILLQAVKGSIWLFEQEQALGFSSVSTNIRMTVIKLKSGGLWVHAPIAPTKECIQVPFLIIITCTVLL